MQIEDMFKMEISDIKNILRNYEDLKSRTRQQIVDHYHDLSDTDTLIETVSMKKTQWSSMSGTSGKVNNDISSMILRHQKLLENWYRELSLSIDLLLKQEEMIRRIWYCYRLLDGDSYEAVTKLYVERQPYKKAEAEFKGSKASFQRAVNRGLREIKVLYDSPFSNEQILRSALNNTKKEKRIDNKNAETYEQLSFGLKE